MTEREAWKVIAEAFYTPRSKRTSRQRSIADDGLCNAIDECCPETNNGTFLWSGMHDKLHADLEKYYMYFCSCNPRRNDILRADYCMLNYYMLGGE